MTELSDQALLASLRTLWQDIDPVPADLADRVVAAIAVDTLDREWELLSLVAGLETGAVRSDADRLTLQFSDGTTNVLLHVANAAGGKRVDGWVDAQAASIQLLQGTRQWSTQPGEDGRFAFDQIPPGLCHLRLTIQPSSGGHREFRTPAFEV